MTPRFFERKSRSDCVHEQVAKLGPVSRAAGMDCKCPLYMTAGITFRLAARKNKWDNCQK